MPVQVTTNARSEVQGNPINSEFSGINRRTVLSKLAPNSGNPPPLAKSAQQELNDLVSGPKHQEELKDVEDLA